MKIPNKIKIGAHTFNVIQTTNLSNDENCGASRMEDLSIFIREDMPQSLQEETLFHECLHMIRQIHGIENKDKDKDESMVQVEAHAIYQLLKENKWLV